MTMDEAKVVKKDAATLFNMENYSGALKGYEELVKSDPKNSEFNYRLGYCYLLTNVNKAKAIQYFEAVAGIKTIRKEAMYFFGLACMYAERWDDAITAFNEYKTATHSKSIKDFPEADRQIEMCVNAQELMSNPVNVTFENPGKAINSIYEDYNPFISANGKTLLFTSRRKGNMGGFIEDLGIYTADVYFSLWKDTAWTKAKSTGAAINTEWDEESVWLSADGYAALVYFDNMEASADIAVSTLKGKTWQKAMLIGEPVNSKEVETSGSMTLDGVTIYFAAERKGTKGGSDIFMSKRKSNNEWGPAVNLGSTINTKYDEDAPFISMDGKTLYFSSKGHNSMGGFDVFRSTYDAANGNWSEPVNIGYPLNTIDDNLFFSMTGDQRTAFISCIRPEGLGDKDIYEITYNDTTDHPFLSLISGIVASETNAKIEITKATLTSKNDPSSVMTYKPVAQSNEFIFAAKPGEYILSIDGFNFSSYSESITVLNDYPLKNIERKIRVKTGK